MNNFILQYFVHICRMLLWSQLSSFKQCSVDFVIFTLEWHFYLVMEQKYCI